MQRSTTFIRFLTAESLLTYEQAKELDEAASRARSLLGQMMLRRKHLTLRQMVELLELQANQPNKRIGELAVEAGHVDQRTLDALLAEQSAARTQHPIDTLRRANILAPEVLVEAMSEYIKLAEEPAGSSGV